MLDWWWLMVDGYEFYGLVLGLGLFLFVILLVKG